MAEEPSGRLARLRRSRGRVIRVALGVAAVGAVAALGVLLLAPPGDTIEVDEALLSEESGGDTTAFEITQNAFGLSARNLGREERRTFEIGDSLFTQNWVEPPSTTELRDGLGPIFNARACASCHVRDGRARPPEDEEDGERGLLLRLSVPGPDGRPEEHPAYGDQLQDRAVLGVPAEGRIGIELESIRGAYADGSPYELLAPTYEILDPAYGPVGADLQISPRIAPQVIGMGLLEAIPEADLLAAADPDDADGDGISGRVNRVRDNRTGEIAPGRFGWKANVATVHDQTAGAFNGDLGVTSSTNPDQPCSPAQRECAAAPDGGSPEIDDDTLAKVVFYTQTLAVPARRAVDDERVRQGAELFVQTGCEACHSASQSTGPSSVSALENQEIHPYTDLLVHDLGEGLADGRSDGRASGREWRTPPLWGIGLVEAVDGHTRFLHDGRARSLEEAVLWHGGEAETSKDAFVSLDADEREALIAFVESL